MKEKFKIPTDAEFLAMNDEEKAVTLAAMRKAQDITDQIDDDAADMSRMSMKDFKVLMDGMIKDALKPLTAVDRKAFAFPGIEDPTKVNPSPEEKYARTVKFLQAFAQGDVQTVRTISDEVKTKANLNESTATQGGFLVPEEFAAEILRIAPLYGVIRRNARIMPMQRDVLNIPAAGATNLDAQFVDEAGAIKSTDPNFRQVSLVIKKLGAIPKLTNELLADANVDTVGYLADLVAEAFARKEDEQGFSGTGSPFVGVLVATGVPTTPHASGTGMAALSYSDLVSVTGNIYSNLLATSKWYFHRSMIAHMFGLITTTGAPILTGSAKAREVLSFPLEGVEVLPSLGNTAVSQVNNTAYAIFGDLRRALIMGERGAISMKVSESATVGGDNVFEQDMVAVRFIERIAQTVALPSSVTRLVT